MRRYLVRCGYRADLVYEDFRLGKAGPVPLVAFAFDPADARSACVAVLVGHGDVRSRVAGIRELGAPLVFVVAPGKLQWWRQSVGQTDLRQTVGANEADLFFRDHRDEFNPRRVYRAKTWGAFSREHQLSFVDVGLLPQLEQEIGKRLGDLIEKAVGIVKSELFPRSITPDQEKWLLNSAFRLLAARILKDKGVPGFQELDSSDVGAAIAKVVRHYGAASAPETLHDRQRDALRRAAEEIDRGSSLALVTAESLAYVYETALVSPALRKTLGIHSTPPYLVDYMLWHLAPWVEGIPSAERNVFEPACGHGAFLVAGMRLLKDLLPRNLQGRRSQHAHLSKRLHGIDVDAFALELARLSLTLADIPNPDGWDLRAQDMFDANVIERHAERATILVSNPPFERFTAEERTQYEGRGGAPRSSTKPAEMLRRALPRLRAGAVFGVVVPQGFLHSKEASEVRRFLATDCEIQEICLFPDKIFAFSDMETAVILGRRVKESPGKGALLRYCRVRERDAERFKISFAVTTERHVSPDRFREDEKWNMRIPDLDELWIWCQGLPRLASAAKMGQGFFYRASDHPDRAKKVEPARSEHWVRGFRRFDPRVGIHELPPAERLNLAPEAIDRAVTGTKTGMPQVLLNYARVSRGPWRLKGLLDPEGHAVTSRFITIRPVDRQVPLEYLWALCNSPIANAYVYAHSMKRDILVGMMRRMPIPRATDADMRVVATAAMAYLEVVRPGETVLRKADLDAALARRRLLELDAEILHLYDLPPRYERALLNLFSGVQREGVPFQFTEYFPKDFEPAISLHLYLSEDYRSSTVGALRARYEPVEAGLAAALDRALEDFED